MPALGPSFGIAPAGNVDVERLALQVVGRDVQLVAVSAHPRERDLRRLLHHVAELAGEDEPVSPSIRVASTKRTSPPVPVTARPVATPGTAVRSAASCQKRWRPRASRSCARSIGSAAPRRRRRSGWRSCGAACRVRARAGGPRLAGVLGDDRLDHLVGDLDLVLAEAVPLALPRPEVAAGDRDLLVDRVAVEADDLHAVEQRPGDRLGDVAGRDEDDLRQVELDVEVVVAERVVLCRVEHLEQRRRRVAAPVGADLVDLVEHDHRVHRPRVAQGTDEPAGQGADVRAPVAADLGFVADAAERHTHELAVERTRDRFADRGLARAGRPDQRQDRAGALVLRDAALLAQLAHGQVLDDPVLHVLEAGVVGVEDLAGDLRVEPLLRILSPRHGEQPVEVGADHRRLARGVAHALEPAELALRLLPHLVGHARFADLRAVLVDHGALVLAELLADRLHLLAQEVLPLLGLRAGLDVLADAPAHLQLGQPLALQRRASSSRSITSSVLEQLDALREGEVGRVGAGVGERTGLGDRAQELADAGVRLPELEDLLDDGAIFGLELARLDGGGVSSGCSSTST